ncbi:DUF2293 domain-containing protein [Lichenifustis flavocetrariae]|uniref:DUF2293 domain-containing protein n=1 Tax=Lichenifustis flavocetrariae TaxID=2949735 RepID=UPI003D0CCA49
MVGGRPSGASQSGAPAALARRDQIAAVLRVLAPRLPDYEAGVVVDRAMDSRGLHRAHPGEAAWLALVAYVRHVLTDYDELLADGYDPESARFFVLDSMNEALAAWGVRRKVVEDGTSTP